MLLGATTPGQSKPGSDGYEGVLHISQSSIITETSPSDCLVSYPGHSLGEFYPSTEMQLVYSAAIGLKGHYNMTGVQTCLLWCCSPTC